MPPIFKPKFISLDDLMTSTTFSKIVESDDNAKLSSRNVYIDSNHIQVMTYMNSSALGILIIAAILFILWYKFVHLKYTPVNNYLIDGDSVEDFSLHRAPPSAPPAPFDPKVKALVDKLARAVVTKAVIKLKQQDLKDKRKTSEEKKGNNSKEQYELI